MKMPDELKRYAGDFGAENARMPYIEAIVRHCADVCRNEHLENPAASTSDDAYDAAINHCYEAVLREFGLES